jgi:hypothetical protein
MKVLMNFLTVVLGIVFLVGCGGGGASSNTKCVDPNFTYSYLQSVFPISLLNESYMLEGKMLEYGSIDDVANYIEKLQNKGYTEDENEPDYTTYVLSDPFYDIQLSRVTIWSSDNYINWHLVGSSSGIDDLFFNDIEVFPPTNTRQYLYGMDRLYASDMTNEFDSYIAKLESDGFKYSEHWESWIKYSEDKCLVYSWGNNGGYISADWEIFLNVF